MAPSSRRKHTNSRNKSVFGSCGRFRTCIVAVVCSWSALVVTLILNHASEPYSRILTTGGLIERPSAWQDVIKGEPLAQPSPSPLILAMPYLRPTPQPHGPQSKIARAHDNQLSGAQSSISAAPLPVPTLLPAPLSVSPLPQSTHSTPGAIASSTQAAVPIGSSNSISALRTEVAVHSSPIVDRSLRSNVERIETVLRDNPEGCTNVILDDGFAAVPDTSVDIGRDYSLPHRLANHHDASSEKVSPLLLQIVSGDLCVAKVACQHLGVCAGFVWRSGRQEAELLSALPPKEEWLTWTSEDARRLAREVTEEDDRRANHKRTRGANLHPGDSPPANAKEERESHNRAASREGGADGMRSGTRERRRMRKGGGQNGESAQRRRLLQLRHQALNSRFTENGSPGEKKKKKTPEERKLEAKRAAQERASVAQSTGEGRLLGPVLYAKVATEDTLTQLLDRFDRRPQLQQVMSGAAALALWPLKGSPSGVLLNNASQPLLSGSGLPGHPRVEFDVYRTAGEWWVDASKAETIDGGICAVKASCAADQSCEGFIWRMRDGAGLLGRGFKLLDAREATTKTKLVKFERKAPRGVMLYVKRPRPLKLGKAATLVSGVEVQSGGTGSKTRKKKGGGVQPSPSDVTSTSTILPSGTVVKASTSSSSSSSSSHPSRSQGKEGEACLNLSGAPWRGSPPFADPLRRREDPEVRLLSRFKDGAVMVDAYLPPAAAQADGGAGEQGPSSSSSSSSASSASSSTNGGGNPSGGEGFPGSLTAKGRKKKQQQQREAQQEESGRWLALGEGPPPEPPASPLPRPETDPDRQQRQRVWVSLTTLPGRIAQIERTVLSLVDQSLPADEVVISVPEVSEREGIAYPIPDWLDALVHQRNGSFPQVRVRRISEDFGPATKLIPSVMEAQDTFKGEDVLVLVVDDDTLYPPRLLETLLEWHRRLPNAALAFSGWPVVEKSMRYPHWSENYLVYGNEVFAPHPVSVIRGNCGYLVQTSFFDQELWEGYSHAPPGAFFMDDVWISGRLAAKGIRRFVVPFDEDQFAMTPNLENVTTLDLVELGKPSGLAAKIKEQKEAAAKAAASAAAGTAPLPLPALGSEKGNAAAAKTATVSKFTQQKKKVGNNRVQANEQALLHFRRDWDVAWDGDAFRIKSAQDDGRGRGLSWFGR